MGLFGKLFNKDGVAGPADFGVSATQVPFAGVAAEASAHVLSAPVTGKIVPIIEVPDPVFSGEMLGKGCAIWPAEEAVYAPCSGTVTVTMPHAVGITSNDGVEVLVHIGVDTVDMGGAGFTGYVEKGAIVVAGQPLIKMDRTQIATAGHPDCVVLIVTNTAEFAAVELAAEADSEVAAGNPAIKLMRK